MHTHTFELNNFLLAVTGIIIERAPKRLEQENTAKEYYNAVTSIPEAGGDTPDSSN